MAPNYRLWEFKVISALNNQDSIDQFDQSDSDIDSFEFSQERIIGRGSGYYVHANTSGAGLLRLYKIPGIDITGYTHTFLWIKSDTLANIDINYITSPGNQLSLGITSSTYFPKINRWYIINHQHSGGSHDPANITEVQIVSDTVNHEMYLNFWCVAKQTEFEFAEATLENPPPDSLSQSRRTNVAEHSILGGSGSISQFIGHGSREFTITAKLFGKTDATNADPHDKLHLQNQLNQLAYNERPLLLEWDNMFFPVVLTDFPTLREDAGNPLIWNTTLTFREFNNDR